MRVRYAAKAQVSMEFLLLLIFVLVVFGIMFKGSADFMADMHAKKESTAAKDMLYRMRDEILIAQNSKEGFSRSFELQQRLYGYFEYDIYKIGDYLYIETENDEFEVPIPEVNWTGSGYNYNIEKDTTGLSVEVT